jgi:hypothetical protein
MTKFLIPAAALITLLVVTDAAFAAGASSFAPGREMHGRHGASARAPGRLFLSSGRHSLPGHPGASGYAPGHRFHHR